MWNDIGELRSISALFQWVSIGLVFFSGFLQIGKYIVDGREGELVAMEQAKALNPIQKPIHTGSATIEMVTEAGESLNAHFMDSGAYVAFGKGHDTMLMMSSIDSYAISNGATETNWKAVVTLDATDPSNGQVISFLSGAEYIQIWFEKLPVNSIIKNGNIILTFNSSVRLETSIPPQQAAGDKILVRDLSALKAKL